MLMPDLLGRMISEEAIAPVIARAKKGDLDAQYDVGMMCRKISPPDEDEAVRWLCKAANSGHAGAKQALVDFEADLRPPTALQMMLDVAVLPFVSFGLWLILVPQHLLPFLCVLGHLAWKCLGPTATLAMVVAYAAWVAATNHLKRSTEDCAPEWAVRALRWGLRGCLDMAGCSLTIINEFVSDVDDKRKYFACYGPHGAFATGSICYAMAEFRLHPLLKRLDGSLMAASVLFYVPFLREVLLVLGCRSASKSTVDALLGAGRWPSSSSFCLLLLGLLLLLLPFL